MGNSEVGHLNIGAGRVVYQDLVKINRACRDDSILKNPEIVKAFEYAKSNGVSVHLMGLVSDGGVHSSLDHLLKLTDIADKYGIERTYVHCFMDAAIPIRTAARDSSNGWKSTCGNDRRASWPRS